MFKVVGELTLDTILSWMMKIALMGLFPYAISIGDYPLSALVLLAIYLSLIPSILESNYRITLPFEIDFLVTLALFNHTFLGEVVGLYQKWSYWDDLLHVFGSAVVALIAFMIVYTLHYTKKLRLTISFIGLFTVTFSLAVGVLWEVAEFIVDLTLDKVTQDDLTDTMLDLIYDIAGGVVVAFLGMLYVKKTDTATRDRFTRTLNEIFKK